MFSKFSLTKSYLKKIENRDFALFYAPIYYFGKTIVMTKIYYFLMSGWQIWKNLMQLDTKIRWKSYFTLLKIWQFFVKIFMRHFFSLKQFFTYLLWGFRTMPNLLSYTIREAGQIFVIVFWWFKHLENQRITD